MHKLLENINGWTQSGPMGNVKQFLPALAIAAGAGGLLAGANATRIMNQPIKAQPISPDEIKNYLSSSQDVVGQMQGGYQQMTGIGQDMMNPFSMMNRQQRGMQQKFGADQLALQTLLNRRQNAVGGGGNSGVMAAQQMEQRRLLANQLQDQFRNQTQQNYSQGVGVLGGAHNMLGGIYSAQSGIDENIAQSAIAQRQALRDEEIGSRQSRASVWSGIGSGLLGGIGDIAGAIGA